MTLENTLKFFRIGWVDGLSYHDIDRGWYARNTLERLYLTKIGFSHRVEGRNRRILAQVCIGGLQQDSNGCMEPFSGQLLVPEYP